MYYTIYKITNLINSKYYIGKHQTKNLDDGYMGSGKILKFAIQKYGIENFKKEILHVFVTEEEMNAKEKELVVVCKESYNLNEGGKGGFSYINQNGLSTGRLYANTVEANKKRSKTVKNYWKNNPRSPEFYKERTQRIIKQKGIKPFQTFLGKKHKTDSKDKMSKARKGKYTGDQNSQFDTVWIHNPEERICKKINKNEQIPAGYSIGRVLDFDKYFEKIQDKSNRQKKQELIKKQKHDLYNEWYHLYKQVGFQEFVKLTNYNKSHPALIQRFKQYVKL